ncbi:MAG TPA: nuclear transport factor 2 family protein [Steroidobacteraceae bacterium]|nr:nuclear transport factor 2 family protein [Steroidobacteraceae bacterium]
MRSVLVRACGAMLLVLPGLAAAAPADVAQLLQRAEAALDLKEIERLQRSYGYYIDHSDWDNVVDLLTDDAVAEYAVSGAYVGKPSIRALLYAIGYGQRGLRPQQLREHTQLQPVITLSPDGKTARGRWRALVLLGQFNEYGRWQAGPYENEYRKEDGRWKISRIHWYETFTVPFKGGWKGAMQATNVADRNVPQPDRPASFTYDPWPAVHMPPWDFRHPVREAKASASAVPDTEGIAGAASPAELARLQQLVTRLEDEREIEILQRTYGYYVDKNNWSEIAQLFTEDGTLEIGGRGVFVGRKRVLQYLNWLGFPVQGRLYDHTQMQPVVHVSPDGKVALGRWRALIFGGDYGASSMFGDCIYENEYRKVNGKWMISKLHAWFVMYTDLAQGWGVRAWPISRPEKDLPPDRPPTLVYDMYPGTITTPMHYENPVTGKPVYVTPAAPPPPATATLAQMATRLARLEDARAIEYLHNAFAYYYDRWQWDDVAELFADNGTIEVAQRGVYRGKSRVRQFLGLFGEQGLHQGELFDHLQYQPVVHVAADGRTAKARVRELAMEGQYQRDASFGGGIYENEYVKQGGVWKISALHLYTTFSADLERGWALGPRPAAAASTVLPPDSPPTLSYSAYPLFYLQPIHYPNPVTGKPVKPVNVVEGRRPEVLRALDEK